MAPWAATAVEGDIPSVLLGRIAHAEIDLYVGDGAAAYRRIDQDWHRRIASPLARLAFVRARMLGLHGVAALAACRSGELDRRLVRAACATLAACARCACRGPVRSRGSSKPGRPHRGRSGASSEATTTWHTGRAVSGLRSLALCFEMSP